MRKAKKGIIFLSGTLFGIAFIIACGSHASNIINALNVLFDKTGTTLSADTVQDAIGELDSNVSSLQATVNNLDSSLTTTSQNVTSNVAITRRTASDTDGAVTVACNIGEALTGGGCTCPVGVSAIQDSSGDTSQQWNCACDAPVAVTAIAFCLSTEVQSVVKTVSIASP